MPADRARVKALFLDATELAESEREAFLREQTRGEPDVYAAVADLLAFHDDADILRDEGAPVVAAPLDPLGLVGARLEDRFVVERFVAEGGFAFVYRALHRATDAPVAIKVFKEVDADERERLESAFRREAELIARLAVDVPAVVRGGALGRCTGPRGLALLFQVLEWLDGDVLRPDPAGATLGEITRRLEPIALALAAAHDAGVAHRDVKPGNLFVTRDGSMRLLDFGIAKVAEDRARGFGSTATARSAFTLNYAAPEQLLNRPTGPWTDVYALAVVCVELLAGRHPYAGLGAFEVLLAIPDERRRPTPRAVGVAVSDDVEALFAAALSISAAARPTARAFWSGLRSSRTAP